MAKKTKDIQYYEAVGRRKESTARVRLYLVTKGKSATINSEKVDQGSILINKKLINEYFPREVDQKRIISPLELTQNTDRFAVSIQVKGGGPNGQVDAIVHGLARALIVADIEYKPVLKQEGLTTRDPRVRERRKVGTGGKARRQKQSPKR